MTAILAFDAASARAARRWAGASGGTYENNPDNARMGLPLHGQR